MWRIFISHDSADNHAALALKQWLVDRMPYLANDIYLDLELSSEIGPGMRWEDALRDAQERSGVVVCLVSSTYEASPYCLAEYRTAENLNKEIILVRLEPSAGDTLHTDTPCIDLFGDGPATAVGVGHGHSVKLATEGLQELLGALESAESRREAELQGSGIFISYRRGDERSFAGRIYERLCRHFDARRIFMDVDTIELGLDFTEVIDHWLAKCSAMLVVIGPNWLSTGPDGRRRLDDPNDFVRLEIETALARREVRVIPVLVEGACMPSATDLPESLAPLARRHGLDMTHAGFGRDFGPLLRTLQRVVPA
jgi:hypothetical protein